MIDERRFQEWFAILADRFRHQMSAPTIALFYRQLDTRMSTEEFIQVCGQFFYQQRDRFPSPEEFINARPRPEHQQFSQSPDRSFLPAEGAFSRCPEDVKASVLQSLRESSQKIRSSVFGTVGGALQDVIQEPMAVTPQVDHKLQDLARFESYKRSYEAYKDIASYQHLASAALSQIESLAFDGHPDVALMCDQFLESLKPLEINDDIAAQIEAQLQTEGV